MRYLYCRGYDCTPYLLSEVLDESLSLQSTLRSSRQVLPSVLRGRVHHLAEGAPEVLSLRGLTTWSRHIHLRTLEGGRDLTLLLSDDLLLELSTSFSVLTDGGLFSSLSRIRTVRTEELVDVISQDIGVRQHHVHSGALFASSGKHVGHAVATLDLLDQSVFHCTGIGVQQGRGFSAEVLENLEGLVANAVQIAITALGDGLIDDFVDLRFGEVLG